MGFAYMHFRSLVNLFQTVSFYSQFYRSWAPPPIRIPEEDLARPGYWVKTAQRETGARGLSKGPPTFGALCTGHLSVFCPGTPLPSPLLPTDSEPKAKARVAAPSEGSILHACKWSQSSGNFLPPRESEPNGGKRILPARDTGLGQPAWEEGAAVRDISADPAAGPGPTPSGEGPRAHPHHPRQACTSGAEPQGSPGCPSCHGRRRRAADRGKGSSGCHLRSRKGNRGAEGKLGAEGGGGAAPRTGRPPPLSMRGTRAHAQNWGACAVASTKVGVFSGLGERGNREWGPWRGRAERPVPLGCVSGKFSSGWTWRRR